MIRPSVGRAIDARSNSMTDNPHMTEQLNQRRLPFGDIAESDNKDAGVSGKNQNSIASWDRPVHNWYRFVLSFPPHLVRQYLDDFDMAEGTTVLDPFCGTGTTMVETKLRGLQAVGVEANPFPYFASCVKTDWRVDASRLLNRAEEIACNTRQMLLNQGIDDRVLSATGGLALKGLPNTAERILIKNSISPLPLHKTLVLLEQINKHKRDAGYKYLALALGKALVDTIGNLRFGPEVGVGKIKEDVPVVSTWVNQVRKMATDLREIQGKACREAVIHLADARNIAGKLAPNSVSAVITSPPYPNEKDYTRTTRLESVILGFYGDITQLRRYKKTLLRSNTRGIYVTDDDDRWVSNYTEVQQIAEKIERRRVELGKTSGFEKLYSRATRLYFGGMARHLAQLRKVLKPNAQLAYVVGDQASYLRVLIRTGELLADIAQELGYELVRVDLFRTRFATATQSSLREEVVVLRWPG